MFHYTIGIAGHIDHGKTTLTKALTGMETDRLREEKERNISIETGFAHFRLPNGQEVGVVDVPGHERFIRQMIAGVAGIDLVLVLIAADEGIMPQTREHLDILGLLGIKKGIVVVSKKDLVDSDFLALVFEEIEDAVQGTFLEYAPVVPISARTGEGIEQLIQEIEAGLANIPGRSESEAFRLPIDRVFTVKGSGTVVTGTVFEGKIQIGDSLLVLPQNVPVRVRQIQVHHHKVEEAYAGQRTAINITGMDNQEITRGDVLAAPNFLAPTKRIDVEVQVLSSHDVMIKHRMRVNVYCGTAEVEGMLLFFDRKEVLPGERVYAQLLLDEPVIVRRDDMMLIRRPTPALTLGGGKVINAYGKKYRYRPETAAYIEREQTASLDERILYRIRKAESTLDDLSRQLTIPFHQLQETVEQLQKEKMLISLTDRQTLEPADIVVHPQFIDEQEQELLQIIHRFHQENPSVYGMKRSELKERLSELSMQGFSWILQKLMQARKINMEGERVASAQFRPHLSPHLEERGKKILESLLREGKEVSDWATLTANHGLNAKQSEEIQRFYVSQGYIVPMHEKWIWPMQTWESTVKQLTTSLRGDEITIADVKDVLGLSRKYLIPILERLDLEGYTVRKGDKRYWKKRG